MADREKKPKTSSSPKVEAAKRGAAAREKQQRPGAYRTAEAGGRSTRGA